MGYLTVREAAERIGVTEAAVYIAIKAARLRAARKYGRWLIRESDADRYAETAGKPNGWRTRQAALEA